MIKSLGESVIDSSRLYADSHIQGSEPSLLTVWLAVSTPKNSSPRRVDKLRSLNGQIIVSLVISTLIPRRSHGAPVSLLAPKPSLIYCSSSVMTMSYALTTISVDIETNPPEPHHLSVESALASNKIT